MRQFMCMLLSSVAGFSLNAAEILWDGIELVKNGSLWCCLEWVDTSHEGFDFQAFFVYDSGLQGRGWTLTPDEAASGHHMKMYEASLGSLVNHEAALKATPFIEAEIYANTFSPIAESWTSLSGTEPRDIYFAIVLEGYGGEGYSGREVYGWAQIGMAHYGDIGYIYLSNSALDLDGGPMIVGGGAWEGATPEPACGLLLLLGGALLALLRRRRGITP